MKITINTYLSDDGYGTEYERREEIIATQNDIKESIHQLGDFEGCSEDATFGRDIAKPSHYLRIIEMAYEAGKNNEHLEISRMMIKEED